MVRRQQALPIPHHKRYLLSIQPPEPDLAARLLTSFRFLLGFARHSYSLPAFHSSLSLNFWAAWVFFTNPYARGYNSNCLMPYNHAVRQHVERYGAAL